MRYRIFNYLRSNHDIGCKTVWYEVLLCIKEDICSSFYREFCRSDVIYMCMMSFMTLLKSHDPNVVIFGANTWDFLQLLVFIGISMVYPYSNSQHTYSQLMCWAAGILGVTCHTVGLLRGHPPQPPAGMVVSWGCKPPPGSYQLNPLRPQDPTPMGQAIHKGGWRSNRGS